MAIMPSQNNECIVFEGDFDTYLCVCFDIDIK